VSDFASTATELLTVVAVGADTFVSRFFTDDGFRQYGGLTAAQAVRAASLTVEPEYLPHAVQCSFVHGGDAARPVEYRVERDRDGRSFATRRVTATQDGALLAHAMVSFQTDHSAVDHHPDVLPVVDAPEHSRSFRVPRLMSMEGRLPSQLRPLTDWPTRFWVRCTDNIAPDDALSHAVLAVYLSDISTGLATLRDADWAYGPTLNHTVWLHRPLRMDDWVLLDLTPRSVAGGRGWYTGTLSSRDGALGASLAQEALFRAAGRDTRSPFALTFTDEADSPTDTANGA